MEGAPFTPTVSLTRSLSITRTKVNFRKPLRDTWRTSWRITWRTTLRNWRTTWRTWFPFVISSEALVYLADDWSVAAAITCGFSVTQHFSGCWLDELGEEAGLQAGLL